jgi:hypothetical protein
MQLSEDETNLLVQENVPVKYGPVSQGGEVGNALGSSFKSDGFALMSSSEFEQASEENEHDEEAETA